MQHLFPKPAPRAYTYAFFKISAKVTVPLWDNVAGLLHFRVCCSTGRLFALRPTGKSQLKSVEIPLFIGTKHCARKFQWAQ